MNSNYLGNLNGLRAFAVLGVVFYHFGLGGLDGGFVGVDVFLVISGFLITRIINNYSNQNKNLSGYFHFLLKRYYRLAPPLIFILLVSLVFGYFLLESKTFQFSAQSAVASSLFLSNFFYANELNYFGPDSNVVTFLHSWSLSLEMQFYIFWGAILFLLKKKTKSGLLIITVALFVISLFLSINFNDFVSSYYLLHTRFYEFMLGALCALHLSNKKPYDGSIISLVSILGLIIVYFKFDTNMAYPSWYGLLPCVFTALIILNLNSRFSNYVFGNRFMAYLGMISYSIYLVHWPISAYGNYLTLGEMSFSFKILSILLVFLLSNFVYFVIERQFLSKSGISKSKKASLIFLYILSVAFSFFIINNSGFDNRFNASQYGFVDAKEDLQSQRDICTYKKVGKINLCYFGSLNDTKPLDVVLMGDSHAWHFLSGLNSVFKRNGISAVKINQAGGTLPSAVGSTTTNKGPKPQTRKYFPLLRVLSPKIVILSARWGLYSNSRGSYGSKVHYQVIPGVYEKREDAKSAFEYSMGKTLDYIEGTKVRAVVIGQVPEFGVSPEYCQEMIPVMNYLGGKCTPNTFTKNFEYMEISNEYFSARKNITFINMIESMCSKDSCSYYDDKNILLYKDGDHITYMGSIFLASTYIEKIILNGLSKEGIGSESN